MNIFWLRRFIRVSYDDSFLLQLRLLGLHLLGSLESRLLLRRRRSVYLLDPSNWFIVFLKLSFDNTELGGTASFR